MNMPWSASPLLAARLLAACRAWDERDGTPRLFAKDASLWTGGDEGRWIDWLDLAPARAACDSGRALAHGAKADGLTRAILVGMGGSSLCPEVLAKVFGPKDGGMPLTVLDTVDPARLRAALAREDLSRALVVVASKSGSTLEPSVVKDLLVARLREKVGDAAMRHFVAVTDPGSNLEKEARAAGWRAIVPGVPGIGGRFSALSPFGIVPAALLGLDLDALLAHAEAMRAACTSLPAEVNPGVALGVALGTLAAEGRDKMTLVASPQLAPLGAWIEQLVAESTGKRGFGILPVDGEPALDPRRYGDDRVFVALRFAPAPGSGFDERVAALAEAGHPVLRCDASSLDDLGSEFFRWEIATAVAGAVLSLHPFDQPDVEAAKIAARKRLEGGDEGDAPIRCVVLERDGVTLEADEATARRMEERMPPDATLGDALGAFLARVSPPDYVALLAWRASDARVQDALAQARRLIGGRSGVATTLGVGPRFLHSTGQLHKGGPATGVFLQVVGPQSEDLPIPGRSATFGAVEAAQSEGDFDVLASRGRRALMVRLHDAEKAPKALVAALQQG